MTARTAYRVTGVREMNARTWWNRWAITAERLGPRSEVDLTGESVFEFGSYERGEEGPLDFARRHGLPTSESEASGVPQP